MNFLFQKIYENFLSHEQIDTSSMLTASAAGGVFG